MRAGKPRFEPDPRSWFGLSGPVRRSAAQGRWCTVPNTAARRRRHCPISPPQRRRIGCSKGTAKNHCRNTPWLQNKKSTKHVRFPLSMNVLRELEWNLRVYGGEYWLAVPMSARENRNCGPRTRRKNHRSRTSGFNILKIKPKNWFEINSILIYLQCISSHLQ